jgi:uncharacterized membrane protein
LQLVTGEFVRLVRWPAWLPGESVFVYLTGVVLVAIGLSILTDRQARAALSLLATLMLVHVFVLYPTQLLANPTVDRPLLRGFMWTNPLKSLGLVGGAALLASRLAQQPALLAPLVRGIGSLALYGAALFALFLFVAGLQHFAYSGFVTGMVPSWMPARSFWTYFTGVALIAGGTGIVVQATARLAAMLTALMIFLWVLLLHLPRALGGPQRVFETAGLFEAVALSGVALVVAATRPRD